MTKPPKRPYHHGDLRTQLLTLALGIVERESVAEVSLRRLAREAGVSPGAPYHHFPDRAALLTTLLVQGHDLLAEKLRAARETAPDPVAALGQIIVAYAVFAAEHPGYIRLMLRPEASQPDTTNDAAALTAAPGAESVELLHSVVQQVQSLGRLPAGDTEPLLHLFWSLAVGYVTLWIDGPIEVRCHALGTTPLDLMRSMSATVEQLLRGFDPGRSNGY